VIYEAKSRRGDVRLRWVWCQDHLINRDDIILTIGFAELERRLTGDIEVVLDSNSLLLVAAEDAQGTGARREESDNSRGEPHRGGWFGGRRAG